MKARVDKNEIRWVHSQEVGVRNFIVSVVFLDIIHIPLHIQILKQLQDDGPGLEIL